MGDDLKNPDVKTPQTGISGRESVFDKRLREFRTSGSFEKPQLKSNQFLKKPSAEFDTPSMDSKLSSLLHDSAEYNELERLAFIDERSGLLNTRTILKKLEKEVKRSVRFGREFSVIVVEMDKLPSAQGLTELAADMLFATFCKLLKKSIREVDILGRFDEPSVLIICPETSLGEAIREAERMKNLIASTHFKQVGHFTSTTVSIGVASYPEHGGQPFDILGAALAGAQQAVASGGNQVCTSRISMAATNEIPEADVDCSPAEQTQNDFNAQNDKYKEQGFELPFSAPAVDTSHIISS